MVHRILDYELFFLDMVHRIYK